MERPPISERALSTEQNSIDEDPLENVLTHTKLGRLCFLSNFEPTYIYISGTTNVKALYNKVHEYCRKTDQSKMSKILCTAYNSKIPRRDEVAFVHAVYLIGETPIICKNMVRTQFPKLVQNDTDLFLFCKYAALIHHEKKKKLFCKTVKKAVKSWYKSKTPEEIAYMFAANRGKNGFTHRKLMKLCRIPDEVLGTKYLYTSFLNCSKDLLENRKRKLPPLPAPKTKHPKNPSERENSENVANVDENQPSTSQNALAQRTVDCDQEKIRSIILAISTLRTTTDPEEAVELITKFNFKFEHLPYHLLQFPEVLKAVAQTISCTQLMKSLWSEKIRKHFSKQEVLKVFKERFQRRGGLREENVDPILFLITMDRLSISRILEMTNNRNSTRGRLVQFSKQLFRHSFFETKPSNKRIHITINLQQNYSNKVLKNTKGVKYLVAAVSLAFAIFKVESNSEVYRWTESSSQLEPLNWNRRMDIRTAYMVSNQIQNKKNNQRLYVPIQHCTERPCSVDLFILIVPSATRGNSKHKSSTLASVLKEYRKDINPESKLVIVDLLRHKRSMTYSKYTSEGILEICGLDEHTIPLIYNFAEEKFN